MPFRFAGIGCLGWLAYLIIELIRLSMTKSQLGINMIPVLADDLLHSVIMSFFCFTVTYFTYETIHRMFLLPKFFPEGNLNQYKVRKKATLVLKMRNFYFSISICPMLFIVSSYVSMATHNSLKINSRFFYVLLIFIIFGIVLLVLTIQYLKYPLSKIKEGTERIKDGDYNRRIEFSSNDDFGELTDAFNDMTASLKDKTEKIATIQDSIIKGMALMVESRDINTGGHINRTSEFVRIFAEKLKVHPDYDFIKPDFFDKLIKAAPMHDLGKIAVPDAVLIKPGKFTPEEYEMMKTHSEEGAKIVEQVIREVEDEEFKTIAINVAHYHHERWDGTGYPEGLKEEDIPFEARVMALADVFDALISKRCYKDSLSYDTAFKIIQESLGTHFDPYLGLQFLECRKELEEWNNRNMEQNNGI